MNQQQISLVSDGIALAPHGHNHQHPLLQHQHATKYTWTKDKKEANFGESP